MTPRAIPGIILLGLTFSTHVAVASKGDELQSGIQAFLDSYAAAHLTSAVQLGWKSADAEFGLAAGQYKRPDEPAYKQVTPTDTFLFGSGTKPVTAAAVFSLVSRGVVALDDPIEKHIDKVLHHFKAGTSMRSLFGLNGSKVTVGQVVYMTSGVIDYDIPEYDRFLLFDNETYSSHDPLEPIQYVSDHTDLFICEPGTCVSYSSTNYILAGFVLLAHAHHAEWWELDAREFFPQHAQDSLRNAFLLTNQSLHPALVVPGHAAGGWGGYPNTTMWNQSATILGWTCGNMVASALDAAKFYWDLLGPQPNVVPKAMVDTMAQFKPLDVGWAKGEIQYGGGLMLRNYDASWNYTVSGPPEYDRIGQLMGHGGDTYGFLSEQGILYGLNASLSIIINTDDKVDVGTNLMCNVIKIAAKVLHGLDLGIVCDLEETMLLI